MRLLFDLQALQNESRHRGIGRYTKGLFDALARRDDLELYALLNGAMDETLDDVREHVASRIGPERILIFPGLAGTIEEFSENRPRRKLSEALYEAFVAQSGCDALLVGSTVEGWEDETSLSLRQPSAGYLKASVLYDLIPLIDPDKHLAAGAHRNWYEERIRHLDAADLLLPISEFSGSEAIRHLRKAAGQVSVISSAVDTAMFCEGPGDSRALLDRLGITRPFVMHAGVMEPRKNFEGLLRAFAALPEKLRSQHQLLFVGRVISPHTERHLRAIARDAGIPQSDLIMPSHISDDELVQLYRACRLFVYPSRFEGFGLPPLEAMSCGCPTIGSNTTSVCEVIGNPAYMFDPEDTAAQTRLIQKLLGDQAALEEARQHARRQAARFSWDKVAANAVAALDKALAARGGNPAVAAYPSAQRMAAHVASRIDLSEHASGDLEMLAQRIAAAETALVETIALGLAGQGRTWRVEGPPFDTTYSLALVNRETARAMADLGWQVELQSGEGADDEPVNPDFLAANPDLVPMYERALKGGQAGSFATSRLNYPPRVSDMAAPINALHHYAWEETGYPQPWVADFNRHLTMMTTLATHIEKIMIDNGVSVPMVTSGCGVDHWDRIIPDPDYRIAARGFRFLHVSSCFPRKGVDALLEAYEAAFTSGDDVTLVIKTFDNPHNEVREMLAAMKARNPRFPDVVTIFGDITDAELKALYGQCQVMVGPSFAEGYGLPFAEAMLSGIPVITTNWGGQLDFCNPGNSWLVDYRFERAKSHFGMWSSAWARADVPSLANAMREARSASAETRAAMAARGREQLMARHKWSDVARRLTAAAATLPAARRRDPHIGWISTWHSKCGIATYSEHLTEAMPTKVTVFAPEKEATLIGHDASVRLWRQSKSVSNLGRILASPEAEDVDVFVIQFNFGFYNHADLANFIRQAKDRQKAVVISLHATRLPWDLQPRDNYDLVYLAPALSECDRILVHSIDDLNRLKDIGLIDNVALFPHGVLRRSDAVAPRAKTAVPTIATYGFALPHKGLAEMLQAVRLLHDRGQKVRLKMVNAEYPIEESAQLIAELERRIEDLELEGHVEMHNRFLSDEDSLALLTDSDLIVFAYQNTAESASGAVRYGMAVERPVAVTPLPIFNDLEGAVFRMDGTSPSALANGIAAALDAVSADTPEAAAIAEKATRWRDEHDYRTVGNRLFHICKALASR